MSEPLPTVRALLERGVIVHAPHTVHVDPSVSPDRIAKGAEIHPGCRLTGATTSIGPDSIIGSEAPVTLEDTQLGTCVELKGGYFSKATFLDGASMGSCAHVRPGTLLEESASGAHSVGFKQTVLLSFVVTGSLVNFCDCLMSGGTNRKRHSEVGSSYVHFNFTPHQDKATASLIGDVPRGVMLDQAPIFLGGQGGIVGPARVEYGTLIPAGVVLREDALEPNQIVYPRALPDGETKPYSMGAYRDIRRIVVNNLIYLGNIRALRCWYAFVRRGQMAHTPHGEACYEGALSQLKTIEAERLARLREFANKLPHSIELLKEHPGAERWQREQRSFLDQWPAIEAKLHDDVCESAGARDRDTLLHAISHASHGSTFIELIQALTPAAKQAGTRWLQAVVDSTAATWQPAAP
jgi:bifunctional UDP-N-acetylglucosamine pyrophosphorylase / glucosamine-1-phosphate N-acetyltransferase